MQFTDDEHLSEFLEDFLARHNNSQMVSDYEWAEFPEDFPIHYNSQMVSDNEWDTDKAEIVVRNAAIVSSVLLSIVGIVGLVLNGLVIAVILLRKTLRSNYTNILIVNQVIASFLFILFYVPFLAANYAMNTWPFGNYCSAWWYLHHVCNYVMVYTLVLFTADRFLVTFYNSSSKSLRTVRNTVAAILVLWLVVLACCVPVIFVFRYEYIYNGFYCMFTFADGYSAHAFLLSILTTSFFVPLTIMVVLTVPIRLCRNRNYSMVEDGQKGDTILVVSWVIAFLICNTPYNACMLHNVVLTGIPSKEYIRFFLFAEILMIFTFCVYPIIYIVMWKCFPRFVNGDANNSSGPGPSAPPPLEMTNAEMVQLTTNEANSENLG